MKKIGIKTLLVSLLVFSMVAAVFATAAYGGNDSDVNFKRPIDALVEMGLMDEHAPGDTVTRFEAVSALLGVMAELHLIDDSEPDAGICDAENDDQMPTINRAVNIGIMKGDCTGYVSPARAVSLSEMLTMCLRALGYGESLTSENVYELAESAQLYLYTEGDDLYFYLTADKMAEILWNMLTANREGEELTYAEELLSLEIIISEVYEELCTLVDYVFGVTSKVATGGALENGGVGSTNTDFEGSDTEDTVSPPETDTVAPPETDTTAPSETEFDTMTDTVAPPDTETSVPPESDSESESETTTEKETTTSRPAQTENDDGWGPIWRP